MRDVGRSGGISIRKKIVKFGVALRRATTYKDPLRQGRFSVLFLLLLDIVNRAEGMRRRRCVLERGHYPLVRRFL